MGLAGQMGTRRSTRLDGLSYRNDGLEDNHGTPPQPIPPGRCLGRGPAPASPAARACQAEGKAVLLRVLAPASTMAWKFLRPLILGA